MSRRIFLTAVAAGAAAACSDSEDVPTSDGGADVAQTDGPDLPDGSDTGSDAGLDVEAGVDAAVPPDPLEAIAARRLRQRREVIEWESGSWPDASANNPVSNPCAEDDGNAGSGRYCASYFAHEYG